MNTKDKRNISDFRIVGINYKKSDAAIRGAFAINNEQYATLLSHAAEAGIDELFVLSTCNRTELYGFADHADQYKDLICQVTDGDRSTLSEICYEKNGWEAVEHLFQVSAGLDSQILGDYEILGQIKTAAKFAKEHGFVGAFLERVINCVLQASKAIKTHTTLSSGTVSVSFAAIQYIKEHVKNIRNKKILLLGTGKIGRNTCKNMVDYLGTTNITLVNRTEEKAQQLAAELNLKALPLESLSEQIQDADIILVATNSPEPTIFSSHLAGNGKKLIIDLSVPCNVEAQAQTLDNVTFVNVDELSKIKDRTLEQRKAEVPKAVQIIDEHIQEFREWCEMRKNVPLLKEVKHKLKELNTRHMQQSDNPHIKIYNTDTEEKIQKVINVLAMKMRQKNTVGCHYIEAINEFIS